MDPDQVVKALEQRQSVSKKNYDKQSRDLSPLEAGDKVRIRPIRDREWRKTEVLPRSYLLQDEQGCVYRRNRRQVISVPNDHPMPPQLHPSCPQLHDPFLSSPCADVAMSPLSPTTERQAPGQMELAERPAGNAEHSPIATRSGRQVRKPQRLIASCKTEDVVILLNLYEPTYGLGSPDLLWTAPQMSARVENLQNVEHF